MIFSLTTWIPRSSEAFSSKMRSLPRSKMAPEKEGRHAQITAEFTPEGGYSSVRMDVELIYRAKAVTRNGQAPLRQYTAAAETPKTALTSTPTPTPTTTSNNNNNSHRNGNSRRASINLPTDFVEIQKGNAFDDHSTAAQPPAPPPCSDYSLTCMCQARTAFGPTQAPSRFSRSQEGRRTAGGEARPLRSRLSKCWLPGGIIP